MIGLVKIKTFHDPNQEKCLIRNFDWQIKEEQFEGKTWKYQVTEIITSLPNKVYISFDIDGLSPELCPNTGTPVAGGFKLEDLVDGNVLVVGSR